MGLFSGIFGNSKTNNEERDASGIPWKSLETVDQLDDIISQSKGKPQVIFKHSTTCGISRMVLNMFNSGFSLEEGQMDFYFLDLQAHRNVSNEVAQKLGVQHQSPQLLIVKNGVVVHHDSHGAISDIQLEKYL